MLFTFSKKITVPPPKIILKPTTKSVHVLRNFGNMFENIKGTSCQSCGK
jgi:hypothetical protein